MNILESLPYEPPILEEVEVNEEEVVDGIDDITFELDGEITDEENNTKDQNGQTKLF